MNGPCVLESESPGQAVRLGSQAVHYSSGGSTQMRSVPSW
jgi:hypothetical protein